MNVRRLSELYFLNSMLEGTCIELGYFFANQLLSATTSSVKRIMIGGLITPIARSISIEPNHDDRVSGSEMLASAAFGQIKFCTMEAGYMCWIYPGNRLMPLPIVYRNTLLSLDNLSFPPGDEELVHLATPLPPPPI